VVKWSIEEPFPILRLLPRGGVQLGQDTHLDLAILDYVGQDLQKWYCSFSIALSLKREYFDVSFFISNGWGGNYSYSKMCSPPSCYSRPSPTAYSDSTARSYGLLYSLISPCSRAPCE
jgi:hypothetical protein